MNARFPVALFLLSAFVYPVTTFAQWQPGGAPISTVISSQVGAVITPDGAGGTILAWEDGRFGAFDIYAQRVDASGTAQWATNGIPICTAVNSEYSPMIISDGAGGAIVTWYDYRGVDPDIYAQRINGNGTAVWMNNGVAICTATGFQGSPILISDGAGGAIISWSDSRGTSEDIYAQRINATGVVQWTTNGVPVCTAAGNQYNLAFVSDGAGGAIAAWNDFRNGVDANIYAQRISAAGTMQWATDGVAVCTAANNQFLPTIVSDGASGAIVTWEDYRSGVDYDIYAQRINAAGIPQWTADGVTLCTAAGNQNQPRTVSDGAGGAIAAWLDYRGDGDVYAQRIDASGSPQWTYNGAPVCNAVNFQSVPSLVSDGEGGAIATWEDDRNGTNYAIYAQRINALGVGQWATNGVNLRNTASGDGYEPTIMEDGTGGTIVAWYDFRANSDDVYAQRVDNRYGYWGHPEPTLYSVADVPADQGGKVNVNWYASGRDALNQQTISQYTIWRATTAAAARAAMKSGASLVGLGDIGPDFSGPAIREQKTATSDYFWELIGTQDAIYRTAYSFTASTNFDSTAAGPATNEFQIVAHAYYSQYINWPSNVVSGHSVDNLAPAAPLYLIAQRNGSEVDLTWNGVHVSDLKDYTIYRSDASGVTPIQTNFLANDVDTVLVDSGAPLTSLYYIVTAYDVHGNQSKPSNEASVSAATNAGRTPSLTALTVLQNRPNPFGVQTELEIGLPAASEIHLEVYDVAGHRVREEDIAGVRGWQAIRFSGRDDRGEPLASGMYFYKVAAHGEIVTRKMLITR